MKSEVMKQALRTITSAARRRPALATALAWGLLLATAPSARAVSWTLPLTVVNGSGTAQSLELGIHPQGTLGVDAQLGEVGLPPWPPSTVFDARFVVTGTEGLRLDIRDDTRTERSHVIQWQAGAGGYPIIVRWNRASLPASSFMMSDGYTGMLIAPFDMAGVDSLRINASQSYIKKLRITVVPGEAPPAPPVISPGLANQVIFVGQRFADIALDEQVVDSDTPDAELQWHVTGNGPPWLTIGADRVLRVESPADWRGTGTFTLRVVDPGGLEDQQEFTLTAVESGLPSWERSLTITNQAGQTLACDFGLHPEGTDGLDPTLGELELPPWPPSGVFDARFLFPDALTHSRRDLRANAGGIREYRLEWQAGTGGYPVTVTWPANLPPGDYHISDTFGGTFVPPVDMTTTQSLIVPESLSFITSLLVTVDAVIDTTAPQGPAGLAIVSHVPNVSVRLDWSAWPCLEDHFAYYEVLFDTLAFDSDAAFAWDWSEDPALALQQTTGTTVALPVSAAGYVFRIRAWDAFGNVGAVSNPCSTGAVAGNGEDPIIPASMFLEQNAPNPFNPLTHIRFTLSRASTITVGIFDVSGRRVRQLFSGTAAFGAHELAWDGRADDGAAMPSGVYFYRLSGDTETHERKMMLLR